MLLRPLSPRSITTNSIRILPQWNGARNGREQTGAPGGYDLGIARKNIVRYSDVMTADDPIALFCELLERARQVCTDDPTAMVLSTVDAHGRPSARYVLLKDVDRRGFVFYTNLKSRKAEELDARPAAALCFYWAPLDKQIRIEGDIGRVSEAEADAYFATRPREFQIGAWASSQSAVLASREVLDARVRNARAHFEGQPVPRPQFWSGFRVVPMRMEFWTRHPARLHERVLYERRHDSWVVSYLFP